MGCIKGSHGFCLFCVEDVKQDSGLVSTFLRETIRSTPCWSVVPLIVNFSIGCISTCVTAGYGEEKPPNPNLRMALSTTIVALICFYYNQVMMHLIVCICKS
jgi:hypothetical protein